MQNHCDNISQKKLKFSDSAGVEREKQEAGQGVKFTSGKDSLPRSYAHGPMHTKVTKPDQVEFFVLGTTVEEIALDTALTKMPHPYSFAVRHASRENCLFYSVVVSLAHDRLVLSMAIFRLS